MKTVSVLLVSILAACGPSDRTGTGDDDMPPTDDPPVDDPMPQHCNKMDIIFVVDDSGSMAEEQNNLATNFPQFANVLSTFVTADGEMLDYRVAVTTTGRDMDYSIDFGGQMLPQHESGDNGAFKNNCGVSSRYLSGTDANMSSTLSCRANVGTGGSWDSPPDPNTSTRLPSVARNVPTAAPSARTRRSGPSGVATELMKIGITGRAAASPNSFCSGCTVPWSTSMLAEIATSMPDSRTALAQSVATSAGTLSGPASVP